MKKRFIAFILASLILTSVIAPCAMAAPEPAGESQTETVTNEDDAAAPAAEASESFYNKRNLILGGCSLILMAGAFALIKVKSKKG